MSTSKNKILFQFNLSSIFISQYLMRLLFSQFYLLLISYQFIPYQIIKPPFNESFIQNRLINLFSSNFPQIFQNRKIKLINNILICCDNSKSFLVLGWHKVKIFGNEMLIVLQYKYNICDNQNNNIFIDKFTIKLLGYSILFKHFNKYATHPILSHPYTRDPRFRNQSYLHHKQESYEDIFIKLLQQKEQPMIDSIIKYQNYNTNSIESQQNMRSDYCANKLAVRIEQSTKFKSNWQDWQILFYYTNPNNNLYFQFQSTILQNSYNLQHSIELLKSITKTRVKGGKQMNELNCLCKPLINNKNRINWNNIKQHRKLITANDHKINLIKIDLKIININIINNTRRIYEGCYIIINADQIKIITQRLTQIELNYSIKLK